MRHLYRGPTMNSIDRYTKKFRKFYKKSFPIVKIKVKQDDVTTTFLIFGHIEITCHCSTLTSSHFTLIFLFIDRCGLWWNTLYNQSLVDCAAISLAGWHLNKSSKVYDTSSINLPRKYVNMVETSLAQITSNRICHIIIMAYWNVGLVCPVKSKFEAKF